MPRLCIPGFDYRQPNAFFVTIVARDRRDLFGEVLAGRTKLNRLGSLVTQTWFGIPMHFAHVLPDVFIVMPNHIHGILWTTMPFTDYRPEAFGKPVAGSIPTAVRSFKSAVTNIAHRQLGFGLPSVWHPRSWTHVIGTESRLDRIRRYIETNPTRPYA